MMDHRPSFTYGSPSPIRIALLDNRAGSHHSSLLHTLRGSGFHAETIVSETDLYHAVLTQRVTIVVLDPDLSNENGFAVARHLRTISDVGIVMLTRPHSPQESIDALRNGADIHLPKPIDVDLLIATMQGLGYRMTHRPTVSAVADSPAELGWRVQADGWQLASPNGHVVSLTSTEQRIIKILIQKKGQLVSREALLEAATPDAFCFDPHRVEMVIHRLRRKVLDHTGETLPLRTVRGKGYLLTCNT